MGRMNNRREEIRKISQSKQKALNVQNKATYGKRHKVQELGLQPGDTVWRTDDQVTRRTAAERLEPMWEGPYKVAKLTKTGATIEKDGKLKHVAIAMLKKQIAPARSTGEHRQQ